MELDFFVQNWYLFLALGVIVALLFMDTVRNRISGIQSVTVTRLPQLINHEDAVVIDVCESAEYRNGHIPGAINIPVSQLEDSVTKLAKYKKKGVPLVVACQTGNRSARAAAKLRKLEFDNVYALTGGLVAWQKENLPVEK